MPRTNASRSERPKRIGIYEIVKRIGAGGMGTVYLAKDTDLGRMVALKVLPAELAAKTEMISRFRQEAQHAAKLRHENIVTLYGCGEYKGLHFLAMEFVDGCNLHEYIDEKGKLAPEDARILMVQAAKALVCAHEQNIVHRDIKPSNFLLAITNGRPVVKLTDFGLARTVDDFDGKMTRSGTTVGTVDYISPEQARSSRAADIRSDIYSLGCTLYHMLAGRPPFPDGDLTERLLKHVEEKPQDILKFNPQTPAGLVQVLDKMLAKKPENRYQNPGELLKDLANPPKVPAISAREALELLAEASGEKPRPSRASSMQETRRQTKEVTAPIPVVPPPAVVDMKLHYRKKKNERRKRPEKGDANSDLPTSPLVLEGLGPWLGAIGGVAAVALIAMAILFKWGAKTENTRTEDPSTITKGEEKTPEKQGIEKQSKKVFADLKDKLKTRRDGENPEDSRAALEAMKDVGQLPQIEIPGDKLRSEMTDLFSNQARSQYAQNLEDIKNFNENDPAKKGSAGRDPNSGRSGNRPNEDGAASTSNRTDSLPPQTPPEIQKPGDAGPPPRQDQVPPETTKDPAAGKSGAPQRPAAGQKANPPLGEGQRIQTGTPGSTGGRPENAPNVKVAPRILQVQRGMAGGRPGVFESIAAAVVAARSFNAPVVLEIKDNGPFFESGLEIRDQSVVLRGAEGYRPLIALGNESGAPGSRFLFEIENGTLSLENLDLVIKIPDAEPDTDAALIRLGEGNLLLEDCVLSLAGRTREGLTAIRFDGAQKGTGQSRCWLRSCFFRGADMTAFDLRAPECSITVDGCLLVGHDRPLVKVRSQKGARPTNLKVAHTTLVNGQALCQIDAASVRDADSAVQFVLWDSLLARTGTTEAEPMLRLGANFLVENLHWRAVNCLYSGWQSLLQYAGGMVGSADLAAWHALLHQQGGDKAVALSWPAYLPPEIDRLPTAPFRTAGTATAFRDSTGKGVVGCPIQDLPTVRLSWPSYTYDRAPVPALDARAPDRAPEIDSANDGRYHGGRVDVSRTDLGEHLQKLQDAGQLASRVVIHLTGRGIAQVTPFRLKNVQLVLYVDPASASSTLSPKPGATADALMSFENGACELIGVNLSMATGEKGVDIASFVQTKNANLRLFGCRLKAVAANNSVRTLLAFAGSGHSELEQASDCVIADCVLQTNGWALKMSGNGSRLRVQNSLLIAGEDAIVLEPGTLSGPLNLHCVLDHNTIAARRAAVRVQDVTAGILPLDAMPVQTRGCVFLNPFGELAARTGLLAFEDRALSHGLVSWQPDGNAYDKQLSYAMARSDGGRDFVLSPEAFKQICGPLVDRRAISIESGTRDFKLESAAYERLSLSASVRAKIKGTPPGADFELLGIGKR